MTPYEHFNQIIENARKAGMDALEAAKPTPVIFGQAKSLFSSEIDMSKPTYYEEEGVCGFASIHFKGNTAFGRWAKKSGIAKPHDYYGGLYIWVSEGNQSMARKEAYARAFVKVLKDAGINDAWMTSRMD